MGNSIAWKIIIPTDFVNFSPLKKEIKVISSDGLETVFLKSSNPYFKKIYDQLDIGSPILAEVEYDWNLGMLLLQSTQPIPNYYVEGKIHYVLNTEKELLDLKYQIIFQKNYKSSAPKHFIVFCSNELIEFDYGITYEFEFKVKNIITLELINFRPLLKHTINYQEQKENDSSCAEID